MRGPYESCGGAGEGLQGLFGLPMVFTMQHGRATKEGVQGAITHRLARMRKHQGSNSTSASTVRADCVGENGELAEEQQGLEGGVVRYIVVWDAGMCGQYIEEQVAWEDGRPAGAMWHEALREAAEAVPLTECLCSHEVLGQVLKAEEGESCMRHEEVCDRARTGGGGQSVGWH